MVTIDQLKSNMEKVLESILLNNENALVTTPAGNVIIITEKDYYEYLIDHFNIIYRNIKDKSKIVKK